MFFSVQFFIPFGVRITMLLVILYSLLILVAAVSRKKPRREKESH